MSLCERRPALESQGLRPRRPAAEMHKKCNRIGTRMSRRPGSYVRLASRCGGVIVVIRRRTRLVHRDSGRAEELRHHCLITATSGACPTLSFRLAALISMRYCTGTRPDGRIAPGEENSSYRRMDTVVAVR